MAVNPSSFSRLVAAVLLAVFVSLAPAMAFASSPEVIASSPVDGATDVPCEGRMWLQFENNVAAVPGNAELVSLETADGGEVPAERYSVSLPDTEVEFGYRQYIWIDVNGLEPGAEYVIRVLPGITAKNGAASDSETRISFTTAAEGREAAALEDPSQVEGGSGNGDGTGGGKAEAGVAAGEASSGSAASAGASDEPQAGDEAEVVYVDANGKPIVEEEPEREPMPIGEVALFALCAIVVAAGLVLAVRKSRANVIGRDGSSSVRHSR